MTNSELLRQTIRAKGLKYSFIAQEVGITPYCLRKKIDNENDFKGREIAAISKLLSLTDKERDTIFFASV